MDASVTGRMACGLAGILVAGGLLVGSPGMASARITSIVVDDATGKVISADEADRPNFPASLTKMMTLYLTFEALRDQRISLGTRFRVSPRAASMPPTRLGLRAGTTIRVGDAIQAIVIKSANDVAVVLGEGLGGTEARFASLMTRKAHQMGMTRTTFLNASGLPNPGQQTTARDLSVLARNLIDDFPEYYHYFGQRSFAYRGRIIPTHNRLMLSYAGMDGLKTGYIRASGYNLASSAVRDGRRLVAIVLGGPTSPARNREMAQILDSGFAAMRSEPLVARRDKGPARRPTVVARLPVPPPVPAARQLLVAAQVPPASGDSEGEAEGDGGTDIYAVQVGAFSKRVAARDVARHVLARMPDVLGGADVTVTRLVRHRKTLYLARLTGLTEDDALTACATLKAKRHDCMVVKLVNATLASN
jgi:D-alanyl-D-alanine carboxypeptidase